MESNFIELRVPLPQQLHREYKSRCSLVGRAMREQGLVLVAQWCEQPIESLIDELVEESTEEIESETTDKI